MRCSEKVPTSEALPWADGAAQATRGGSAAGGRPAREHAVLPLSMLLSEFTLHPGHHLGLWRVSIIKGKHKLLLTLALSVEPWDSLVKWNTSQDSIEKVTVRGAGSTGPGLLEGRSFAHLPHVKGPYWVAQPAHWVLIWGPGKVEAPGNVCRNNWIFLFKIILASRGKSELWLPHTHFESQCLQCLIACSRVLRGCWEVCNTYLKGLYES